MQMTDSDFTVNDWRRRRPIASTPPLSFLQTGCSSCRATNSVKAEKASKPNYIQPTAKHKQLNATLATGCTAEM